MPHAKPDPPKACEHCGAPMTRKRINGRLEDMGVFLRRKFCDRSCMAASFRSRPKKPDPNWMTAHYHARNLKPPGPCEMCGSTGQTDVHHRNENWRDNRLENLQRLCRGCHMRVHRMAAT